MESICQLIFSEKIRNQIFKNIVPRDPEGQTAINTLDFCEFTGKFINIKKETFHKENGKISKTT